MHKSKLLQLGSLLLGSALMVCAAQADAALITLPNSAYTSGTTLIAINGNDGDDITTITGGGITVTFSASREIRTVPNGGWTTWALPPNSETATPRVLAFDAASPVNSNLTLTFSQALRIFGLELEPDDQNANKNATAEFFNGSTLLASTTISVNGNAGSRLFAFDAANGPLITSARFSLNPSDDFAIAQLRFSLSTTPPVTTPEPAIAALMLLGVALLALPRFLRGRHNQS